MGRRAAAVHGPESGGNKVQGLLGCEGREGERAPGPVGFLVFFGLLSLAFKVLLYQASAELSGLTSATIPPCSHLFPCSPSCSRFPRQHPLSRPLAMLSLLPRLASHSLRGTTYKISL